MKTEIIIRRCVLAFLICLVGVTCLSGCGTPFLPTGSGMTIPMQTVTIKAPPGNDWDYFTEEDDGWSYVSFLRRGDTPSHHFMADLGEIEKSVDLIERDDIRESVVRPALHRFMGERKTEVVRREVEDDPRFAEGGVRFFFEAKDFEAPGRGDAEFLLVRMWGYGFIHPDHPDTVVIIAMSERANEDEFDPGTEEVAEQFFSGLELK